MQERLRPVERRDAQKAARLDGDEDLLVPGRGQEVFRPVPLGRNPGEGVAQHAHVEAGAGRQFVRPRAAQDQTRLQACIVHPSTPMAAWRSASERVGCGRQVRATSSDAARSSMATAYSPTISLTEGPIRWAPRISSVVASASTFTKPSVSWLILARLLAVKGNLPAL